MLGGPSGWDRYLRSGSVEEEHVRGFADLVDVDVDVR